MSLTHADIDRLETFLNLDSASAENRDLATRALAQLRQRASLNEADLVFLRSWLKASDLILAGLQVLEMADPGAAEPIRHERECTEMAFNLLPALLGEGSP
jgi:hypothetical protein